MRAQGEETPSESEPLGDDDEEEEDEEEGGGVISSPRALSPEILPPPGDLFGRQVGIPASACQGKHPWADVGGVSIPPP
jgi:hypothetical protein